ncbi:class I SAM-dependent rRNA methyltransferase [Streptococcus sp. DD12]|uniref:class I SAM-dependent rRNA methyltransferase n=1 Tax=Streptococcus sp. DD12 TaxID=1777880 RepID=UPI0007954423|nr:class I SAM-dependent rRNA methyltransferase [Streptococcus sp. DD12]KXT76867.1 LSU m5C1962 methyltransferase RlmI [Streptococcus sp. DD12]
MKKLYVSNDFRQLVGRGQQRLPKILVEDKLADGVLNHQVIFYTGKEEILGTGYLSEQNKGIGWFVSEDVIDFSVAFFCELFIKSKQRRNSFENSPADSAYRLFNQDGDGFGGFTIDRYGDYALFSWYNAYVYGIKDRIIEAFKAIYPEIIGAYEKVRFQNGEPVSQHVYGERQESPFLIMENGVHYQVFLNDGLMTGIFLDQHHVRGRLVDGLALGKRVLNLFSYTAAFSVAAAMGGSLSTVSVDLAKRSRDLSAAHFEANGLSLENNHFVVMDCFEYFRYAQRHQLRFDVIVIDPPSFARNKKMTFSVSKDYYKLIAGALELLAPGGTIIASTNSATLSLEQFKKQLKKGLGKVKATLSHVDRLPADFPVVSADPQSNYLKVVTIKVNT